MQEFKFRLDTGDNDMYGGTLIGTTINTCSDLRVEFLKGEHPSALRGGILRVSIEQHKTDISIRYWQQLKYINILDLETDFVIRIDDKKAPTDFDWISFYFTSDENGLLMKKVGQPNTYNAGNLSNSTLDRMVLQEGYVMNKFQMRVVQTLVKNNKHQECEKQRK